MELKDVFFSCLTLSMNKDEEAEKDDREDKVKGVL